MPIEPVKAYLLGILSDSEATRLEARYFQDSSFLNLVEKREEELILEYLDGRLTSREKELFEKRYCTVPLLKQKLSVVQIRRRAEQAHRRTRMWQAAGIAVACSVAMVALWLYSGREPDKPNLIARQAPAPETIVVSLHLSPGVQRSAGTFPAVTLPERATLSLVLELPGLRTATSFSVRILRVASADAPALVWTSPTSLMSHASATGQNLNVRLEASLLSPDDYVAELLMADGAIAERYLFRVAR